MSSRGKSWSAANVACPRPEHAGSRVRLDGRYGSAERRRQRYRCIPDNGERAHRFTEVLPREESWNDACESCERDVGLHEGPHAARNYQFVARGIAGALVMIGAGSTYRETALVSRERAKRLRVGPGGGPRFSRHRSLVMDWVEVFAPVVFEPYRPRAWPASGSLLLDELAFRVRDPQTGRHRMTTSPLDGFINPIRASIKPRAYGLKNRQRTNRMLTFMQLHANRQDDQNAYVRHIRACLEINAGRPSITRRAIVDAAGPASLR